YRQSVGTFQKIEDIKNVSGIGDGRFEKIKDKITI
ncbi:MAG: helix-hairpin-helix domain-containing protein, partial [Firmicutes bacterium]|nr:helix-hairpin-helix domain-containing protein [Bacillota bacterium]